MNLDTAKEIVRLWTSPVGSKIAAIKLMREYVPGGLKDTKDYLDHHGRHADDLLKQLGKDFIKDPKELLIEARAELRRQLVYIEELQMQAGEETVSDVLMAAIQAAERRTVTLADLIVVDILHNGESLFSDRMQESPGEHIVIEIHNTSAGNPIATHKVVPTPEWEAAEELATNPRGED